MSVTEAELQAAVIAHEMLAEPGPQGDKGDPGPKGDRGEPGSEGPRGVSGPQGDRGPIGADGALGPVGARGEMGPEGPIGPQGDPGRDGMDGKDGRDAADGARGEPGPRGFAGIAGPQGEKGDAGNAGRNGSMGGGMAGLQIMSAGVPIASQALSFDFGSGVDVVMDRNVARVTVTPGAGSDASYVHDQLIAASTWDITHSLGKYPAVTVIDSSGDECIGDVHYVDTNRLTVAFGAAFSGVAALN